MNRHIGQDLDGARAVPAYGARKSVACFDYILLEVSSCVGGSTEIYLTNDAVPRQDPSVVAAPMTHVTLRIGIVPTFGT